MSPEPESLVLQILRDMRAEIGDMREKMATKEDLAELRSELKSDIADVASDVIELRSDMHGMRKDLGDQIVGLRRAVIEYHTTVIGHGVLISDLEARLRRVEQHLSLDPPEAH